MVNFSYQKHGCTFRNLYHLTCYGGKTMEAKDRIYIALDVESLQEAEKLVASLGSEVGGIKIGMQLHTAVPDILERLRPKTP